MERKKTRYQSAATPKWKQSEQLEEERRGAWQVSERGAAASRGGRERWRSCSPPLSLLQPARQPLGIAPLTEACKAQLSTRIRGSGPPGRFSTRRRRRVPSRFLRPRQLTMTQAAFPPHSDTPPLNVTGFPTARTRFALPASAANLKRDDVSSLVRFLIKAIVELKDETGDFLLRLDDGRVIDTKGWAGARVHRCSLDPRLTLFPGWEWTHGVGLMGLRNYWDQTGDPEAYKTMVDWFEARRVSSLLLPPPTS